MIELPADARTWTTSVTVIGLGSPHGADQAGWIVASRLSERPEMPAEIAVIAEPSLLWHHLAGCQRLILIDALVAGADRGCVVRIAWPDERIASSRPLSTHGMGLSSILRLAQQLGRLPRSVVLFGLDVGGDNAGPFTALEWQRGLDELEHRVREEIRIPPAQ